MSLALITVSKASQWASDYLDKSVTASNISYLYNTLKLESSSILTEKSAWTKRN